MLIFVAPFVGAWIEIACDVPYGIFHGVAPFVGAWIEIFDDVIISHVRENSS